MIVGTVSPNMWVQIQVDKVIIFLAKHNNIGPSVVAWDVIKNLDKIATVFKNTDASNWRDIIDQKKASVIWFMQILQLLVQQFNVVLFYENDFNERLLCALSEML